MKTLPPPTAGTRRRLLLALACRLCGSMKLKRDAVAIECTGCGAIRPRRESDEHIVAAIANWENTQLSEKELGVLRHIFKGETYDQTAQALHLATSTVRTHLHNIYTKLKVNNAVQACLIAYERGWLTIDGERADL